YKNLDIILVNDGSPDNSLKICENFASMDKRIRVISQKNKGLSGARNTGIREAKGDYIFFIDADDYIEEKMIESFVEIVNKLNPDIILSNILQYQKGNEVH